MHFPLYFRKKNKKKNFCKHYIKTTILDMMVNLSYQLNEITGEKGL